jgi:hypothetical protein
MHFHCGLVWGQVVPMPGALNSSGGGALVSVRLLTVPLSAQRSV